MADKVVEEVKPVKVAPEVRQCTDQDSEFFGAVAIKSQLEQFAWFVGRPGGLGAGGHWETSDEAVSSWTVLHS